MKNVQKGFTLIELMIVVAIIGILAAIAIPQYQDYITRAKWQDNIARVQSFKTAVAECLQNNNGSITECDTAGEVTSSTGATAPAVGGNLSAVDYGSTTAGIFTLTGNVSVGDCRVTLTPTSGGTAVTWAFANVANGATTCTKSKTGVGS